MEPGNTEHYLEQLNLTELMEQLNRCFSSAFLADFSLEQLFSDILSGNGKEALQLLGRQIAGSVGQEFSGMRQILSVLLLLGILSVLVSCLMGSFENQQVAQIAHDMFFLLVLTVLLKVFSAVYRITGSTLETLKQFSHLTLPALCLSLGPAAGSVTAAGYYEFTLGFIFLIERFLTGFCLLLLPFWMLLVVLSGVWEEGRLSAMMELVEKSLSWILKFCLGTVTGLGVLQSMVAPALDAWKRTAAQKAIAAIPGLGDLAEGTAQVLLGSAVLVKNSLGMFVGILLAVLLVVPLLKIAAYGVVLKLAGAFVGLVADKPDRLYDKNGGCGVFFAEAGGHRRSMLLDTGGDCELPCRKAIERKSMENLLQVLKEATLFILTTQLFRHLLPGKKYLPYENVILSMAVLSMLIVPILSVVNADLPGEFGERVALLETENEMFSQHLEKLEEQETGLFRNNMADSIEVRVQKEAEAAGVSVKGVRLLEDGTVFISVSGQKHAEGGGQAVGAPGQSSEAGAGQDSGISVEPVRPVGSTKARQEQFVLADGEALKGTAREDLKERFAAVIGIGQTQLEVVEVE